MKVLIAKNASTEVDAFIYLCSAPSVLHYASNEGGNQKHYDLSGSIWPTL